MVNGDVDVDFYLKLLWRQRRVGKSKYIVVVSGKTYFITSKNLDLYDMLVLNHAYANVV